MEKKFLPSFRNRHLQTQTQFSESLDKVEVSYLILTYIYFFTET
jgi:hypothetical protein